VAVETDGEMEIDLLRRCEVTSLAAEADDVPIHTKANSM
jgi:hypothetical protein